MKFSLKNLAQVGLYGCIVWVGVEGAMFIAGGLGWERGLQSVLPFSPFSEPGMGLRLLCWVLGISLILLSSLALADPWVSGEEENINLQNERGKVWLSTRTISDYIQRKSGEIKEVESLKVHVKPSGDQLSLQVDVSLHGDSPLPEVTDRIQRFIEQELKETIGIEKVEGIHIHFKKIGGFAEGLPAPEPKDRPKAIDGKDEAIEPEEVEAHIEN